LPLDLFGHLRDRAELSELLSLFGHLRDWMKISEPFGLLGPLHERILPTAQRPAVIAGTE
jgi:hypothetical protein